MLVHCLNLRIVFQIKIIDCLSFNSVKQMYAPFFRVLLTLNAAIFTFLVSTSENDKFTKALIKSGSLMLEKRKEVLLQVLHRYISMQRNYMVCPFRLTLIGGSFRVTLVVDWWFLPKIFGPWWGPTKAIYRSVNTDRVIILFAGGGDTWTQFSVIELIWTFCTERRWGAKNPIFWSCKLVVQINLYGEFFVGLRQHRKWIWGGDSIWRWWGNLNTI